MNETIFLCSTLGTHSGRDFRHYCKDCGRPTGGGERCADLNACVLRVTLAHDGEHYTGTVYEQAECWCHPTVDKIEHTYDDDYTLLLVHNDPKAKGGES